MKTPRRTVFHFVVGITGLVFAVLGAILGWVVFPIVVEDQVAQTVAIKNGTDAWDRWKELPLPMSFRIYIFNLTNADDVLHKGAKPIVQEVGPFIYTETRVKEDIELHEDEDRAIYKQRLMFYFEEEATSEFGLSQDDVLTVVNIPALSFAQITENIPGFGTSIATFNKTFDKMFPNGTFIQASVRQYIFEGVEMDCDYDPRNFDHMNWMLMCKAYALVHPQTVIIDDPTPGYNTFSFFRYKNNTDDGLYEVRLGIDDKEKIGQIITWNNQTETTKYGGPTCNKIHGTDSTVYRPNLQDDDAKSLYIYNTDACRTIKLTYESETEFREIPGKRYVTDKNVFAGVEENEENYCYCPQPVAELTAHGGCLKSGVMDLSSCQGAPVILSHPHFLFADASYKEMVEGLAPEPAKHQIRVDLEPWTGSPLRGFSRIQMNVFLKSIAEVDAMTNLPNVLLPLMWMEEGVELNDELVDMLNSELLDILYILDVTKWCMIAFGVALLISTVAFYIYIKQKRALRHPHSLTLSSS